MRTAPDFFFDPISQVRLNRWSSRRAALVGDAGYCPTPLTGLLARQFAKASDIQLPEYAAWATR